MANIINCPKVSCLTATHGRFSVLREALACFMLQDYMNAELIILNNHEVPLVLDEECRKSYHGNRTVKVLNVNGFESLGDCRNFLLDLATGQYVRTWDDDDLYFPWAISQGVGGVLAHPDRPAWKPKKSWSWRVDRNKIETSGNAYEATWTTKIEVVKKYRYLAGSGGNEHKPLASGLVYEGGIMRGEIPHRDYSYVYRWGTGLTRISGTLGDKRGLEWRTNRWMKNNSDTGEGQVQEIPLTG